MYLVDTDTISESRKRERADPGVIAFFREVAATNAGIYISAVTVGELQRGVDLVRHRGVRAQAARLEEWFARLLAEHADNVLPLDIEIARLWGRLRVPHPENPLDKQIAATALIHDLTLVTRNARHFQGAGVRLLNPFRQ